MICVPVMTLIFYRRCIKIEDAVGIVAALIGINCITKPTFIFGSLAKGGEEETPVIA